MFHNDSMQPKTLTRDRGRPREFDVEKALRLAIEVFRQRGYTATSIVDLSEGMGLSRGSLYKAFQDKKGIFIAAYDLYASEGAEELESIARSTGTGRDRMAAVLERYARLSQGSDGQRGCLVIATAVELSVHEPEIAQRVVASWQRTERLLVDLLRQAQEDGSVGPLEDRKATACSLLCFMQGMRLVGKSREPGKKFFELVAQQGLRLIS